MLPEPLGRQNRARSFVLHQRLGVVVCTKQQIGLIDQCFVLDGFGDEVRLLSRQVRLANLGLLHSVLGIGLVRLQRTGFRKFVNRPVPLLTLEVNIAVLHKLVVLFIDFGGIGQRVFPLVYTTEAITRLTCVRTHVLGCFKTSPCLLKPVLRQGAVGIIKQGLERRFVCIGSIGSVQFALGFVPFCCDIAFLRK